MYCKAHNEVLWFLQSECAAEFPVIASNKMTDIKLKDEIATEYKSKGRGDLENLPGRLRSANLAADQVMQPDGIEHPPETNGEDDKLLDRVWDELGKKKNENSPSRGRLSHDIVIEIQRTKPRENGVREAAQA